MRQERRVFLLRLETVHHLIYTDYSTVAVIVLLLCVTGFSRSDSEEGLRIHSDDETTEFLVGQRIGRVEPAN